MVDIKLDSNYMCLEADARRKIAKLIIYNENFEVLVIDRKQKYSFINFNHLYSSFADYFFYNYGIIIDEDKVIDLVSITKIIKSEKKKQIIESSYEFYSYYIESTKYLVDSLNALGLDAHFIPLDELSLNEDYISGTKLCALRTLKRKLNYEEY